MFFWQMFFYLVVGHYLADFPLQGDFLANAKNRNTPIGKLYWPHALVAHAFIHAGFVIWITGSLFLAICELVIHAYTDYLKCENKISLNTDQVIHLSCKLTWAFLTVFILH